MKRPVYDSTPDPDMDHLMQVFLVVKFPHSEPCDVFIEGPFEVAEEWQHLNREREDAPRMLRKLGGKLLESLKADG